MPPKIFLNRLVRELRMYVMLMILAIMLRKNSCSLVWYGASCHHSYVHTLYMYYAPSLVAVSRLVVNDHI